MSTLKLIKVRYYKLQPRLQHIKKEIEVGQVFFTVVHEQLQYNEREIEKKNRVKLCIIFY